MDKEDYHELIQLRQDLIKRNLQVALGKVNYYRYKDVKAILENTIETIDKMIELDKYGDKQK